MTLMSRPGISLSSEGEPGATASARLSGFVGVGWKYLQEECQHFEIESGQPRAGSLGQCLGARISRNKCKHTCKLLLPAHYPIRPPSGMRWWRPQAPSTFLLLLPLARLDAIWARSNTIMYCEQSRRRIRVGESSSCSTKRAVSRKHGSAR